MLLPLGTNYVIAPQLHCQPKIEDLPSTKNDSKFCVQYQNEQNLERKICFLQSYSRLDRFVLKSILLITILCIYNTGVNDSPFLHLTQTATQLPLVGHTWI